MYSGRDFCWLYERQDQLAFLDGHVRALAHFGGVPQRMVYDNLKPAVQRLQFPRCQLTERFQGLASHYPFESCFARPGDPPAAYDPDPARGVARRTLQLALVQSRTACANTGPRAL